MPIFNPIIGPAGPAGPTGPAGSQGNPGTSNVPWLDIQAYGAVPHKFAFNQPSAAATTISGSPNVTLSASGGLSAALVNGQGVTIYNAGPSDAQSTPSAPTITCPAYSSAVQTITYKLVGYSATGSLTAASTAGTVSAPAIFGSLPVAISSITASAGVVTANFSTPLNNTVSAGMTIHITNVTGAGVTWNGIWVIASAPTTQQVTFAVSGATGTGSISASSKGRVSNSAIITGIVRSVNGIVTVTTSQNHNFAVGTGISPTEVLIEGCTPDSLNGYFIINTTPTANTFTYFSGVFFSALTGGTPVGAATATVWEYLIVTCPALSAPTIGYYIYSDSAAPGGSLALVGRCVANEDIWWDWGPSLNAGYGAPVYVPTTPPSSAQAGRFTSTIVSGGGTTSIVLANNAGQSIPTLGATLVYDDAPNFTAAANAAFGSGSTSIGGCVFVSPPFSNSDFSAYIFNSPINVPESIGVIFGCECIVNETMTYTFDNNISAIFGTNISASPPFSLGLFVDLHGIANPIFYFGENGGNTGGLSVDGICFTNSANGIVGLEIATFYTRVSNCGFHSASNTAGTAMGILYLGSASLSSAKNLNWSYTNRFLGTGVAGQSSWGPSRLPAIYFRGAHNTLVPNSNDNTVQFTFEGTHSGNGRGICWDHTYSGANSVTNQIVLGDAVWLQAGTSPMLACLGQVFDGIKIQCTVNDTATTPTLFNGATQSMTNVDLFLVQIASDYGVVSGNFVSKLSSEGATNQYQAQLSRLTSMSFVSTAATQDVVSFPNVIPGSIVLISAGNQSAQLDLSAALARVSFVNQGSVTVVHSATSGMIFNLMGSVGN